MASAQRRYHDDDLFGRERLECFDHHDPEEGKEPHCCDRAARDLDDATRATAADGRLWPARPRIGVKIGSTLTKIAACAFCAAQLLGTLKSGQYGSTQLEKLQRAAQDTRGSTHFASRRRGSATQH
jgi:hypothetical protein